MNKSRINHMHKAIVNAFPDIKWNDGTFLDRLGKDNNSTTRFYYYQGKLVSVDTLYPIAVKFIFSRTILGKEETR